MTKQALLIIDVQNGMFSPEWPVYNHETLLHNLRTLIDSAHAHNTPVIYVQHGGAEGSPLAVGTPGWAIHSAIAPQPGELVVQKRVPDSFHETTLRAELDRLGVEQLIIAGIQTDYCVDTTTRRAASEGYQVTLVGDSHSTWGDGGLEAQQIIDHHNRVLGNWFATVKNTTDVWNQ
ncbi:MAG: cysteine hydrolase [Caldilineaceae bacterium]|nr:cysteine hydrolase [Caldilineaceae bacterium]